MTIELTPAQASAVAELGQGRVPSRCTLAAPHHFTR
jgi:hypothetical protein